MNTIEYIDSYEETKISDLYEKFADRQTNLTSHGHEMLNVPDLKVLSYNSDSTKDGEVDYLDAKRLIRHKVSKRMYVLVTVEGDEVTVTEDHGCVVDRDGKLTRVKPSEINKLDVIVTYDENLGKKISRVHDVYETTSTEDYVYDVEMQDDPHLFFANDILIHNSLYINAGPMVDHAIGKETEITDDNIPVICDELDGLCDLINQYMTKLCTDTLHSRYPTIAYKRECFASEGIFTAKKRYALHVRDDEGKKVDKFKYTGIELKKSEHPKTIKKYLKHVYDNSLAEKWKSFKYATEINKIWETFAELDVEELALFKGYGTEKTMEGFLKPTKGTGGHAKAALFYNQLLEDMELEGDYEKIRLGDKVRYVRIIKNNPYGIDVIAWPAHGKYPNEFRDIFTIDYRIMFEKTVLNALKPVIFLNGWASVDPCDAVEVDIMNL
jgi:hypothetical protein